MGAEKDAHNLAFLKKNGITHIINMAEELYNNIG